jgi:phosphoribosylformimino-5-aminoimidazole carboxamide ribonucleotide (ProFAR) isomerase
VSSLVLLPAVDVAGGQAVRLVQGAAGSETSYGDPLEAALAWQSAGAEWLHLVDLDAAFGRGANAELLAQVVGKLDVKVELSGGIRDDGSLERALSTGCARVNIGTAAMENPGLGPRGHRQVRRPGRDRPRRARPDPGRPRLDAGGRRPVRGP